MARRAHAAAAADRIFIIFNLKGLLFILFVVSLFFLARFRSGGGGLPWTLGVSLVVAGLVGTIQSNENLRGVWLRKVEVPPVPEGALILVRVTLENRSARHRCGLSIGFSGWKFRKKRVWVPSLPPHSLHTVTLELPPAARGAHRLPALSVRSAFPLSLCRAWKRFSPNEEAIVYPKPEGVPWSEHSTLSHSQSGRWNSDGLEDVSGHRPWQPGESPSRVDWRIFARRGELVVRTREGVHAGLAQIRWSDTAFLSETEARLRQLSRWVNDCLMAGLAFRLELGRGVYGQAQLDAAREALARFGGQE